MNCPRSRGGCSRRSSIAASCARRGGRDRRHGEKEGRRTGALVAKGVLASEGARAAALSVSREPGAAVDAGAVPRAAEYLAKRGVLVRCAERLEDCVRRAATLLEPPEAGSRWRSSTWTRRTRMRRSKPPGPHSARPGASSRCLRREFVVDNGAKRSLKLREGQHEYTFTEK